MEKQKIHKSMDEIDVTIGGRKIEGIKSMEYADNEKVYIYKRNSNKSYRIITFILIVIIIIQLLYILNQTL